MAKRRNTTLRDLAAAAGVSIGTVSRALKNQPGMSEQTRASILVQAQALGYDSSRLRLEKPRRMLFLSNATQAVLSEAPACVRILQGAEQVCRREEVPLGFLSLGANDPIRACIRRYDPDALLLAGYFDDNMLAEIRRTELRMVLADHYAAERFCVHDDNIQGALLATRHLFEQGCQRVAIIGDSLLMYPFVLRVRGYRQALYDARRLADPDLEVSADSTKPFAQAVESALHSLLELPEPPDGVVACSDEVALCAMRVCAQRGLRIPQDIAFVGYGDLPAAAYHCPALSSIRVDKEELGRRAAEQLINGYAMQGEELLPVELIVRASSQRK